MKKAGYTIGALVILLIAAFAFILPNGFMSMYSNGNESFGSWNGKSVTPNNEDFREILAQNASNFKSTGNDSYDRYYHQMFYSQAFTGAIYNIYVNDELDNSDWVASKYEIAEQIKNSYTNPDGTFNKKAYNRDSKEGKISSLSKRIEKTLAAQRFEMDNFGGYTVNDSRLYGLKTSDGELAFLKDMNKKARNFNLASFNMSDYPDSEKEAYGKANAEKFRKFDLDVVTLPVKKDAEALLAKINSKETTFEDAVNQSMRIFSNETGKLRYSYFCEIEPTFKNAEEAKDLVSLKKDEVSKVYETSVGFSFYKAKSDSSEADFKNTDVLKAVNTYLTQHDFDHIQNYYTETAKAFASTVEKSGFNAACRQFNVKKVEVNDFVLNYGNTSVLKAVPSADGLAGASSNETLLKAAFSLELNKVSEPIVMNGSVVVLQYTKESDNKDVKEDSAITTELSSYDRADVSTVLMNSPKFKNNFQEVYAKYFAD